MIRFKEYRFGIKLLRAI